MYKPSLEEFLKLSRKANVIPVYKEISADLDTPVSSYLKMKKGDYAFLLESVEGQEKIARYSFLGANPCLVFTSKGRNIKIISRDKKQSRSFQTASEPLTEIKKLMKDFKAADVKGLPRFYGGFVGYIGYDVVRFFEDIPDKNPDDLGLADSVFMLTDTILLFDHVNHNIKIICNSFLPCGKNISDKEKIKIYHKAIENIEEINKDFNLSFKEKKAKRFKAAVKNITSNFQKSEFCSIVDKAKEYIRKGDIIQVVLSQRFKIKTQKDPFDIYRDLRSLNPSPYMFFLKLKDFILVGSSPEMLVRCENGILEARPIAGTRRRGTNDLEDSKLAKELLQDKKERAEHVMLVDLARNDLGRVAKTGNVTVGEFMRVERYSHVMHIVSDVTAELDPKNDAYDVLRACFPAGTVSGSPKIRAMEIIDELENTKRGPYAGCVGYFSFSQNMDTCITIRTIVIKDNMAYIQAGAGIVLDSIGENEYLESINKAKALVEAINNS